MSWRGNDIAVSAGLRVASREDAGGAVRAADAVPFADSTGPHGFGHRRGSFDLRDDGALSRRLGPAETRRNDTGSRDRGGCWAGSCRYRDTHMIRTDTARHSEAGFGNARMGARWVDASDPHARPEGRKRLNKSARLMSQQIRTARRLANKG